MLRGVTWCQLRCRQEIWGDGCLLGQLPGRVALKATVSGVSTDALLFSWCGMPLVHRYCVFSGGGAHVSLRGSSMSRLRAFTVKADADGRLACKRDSKRSSSRWENSALQRDLCHRQSGDISPHCKSRRALSPRTKTFSTTTTSSTAVTTSIPRLCLCGGRRSIFSCQSLPTRVSFHPDFSLCGSRRRSI